MTTLIHASQNVKEHSKAKMIMHVHSSLYMNKPLGPRVFITFLWPGHKYSLGCSMLSILLNAVTLLLHLPKTQFQMKGGGLVQGKARQDKMQGINKLITTFPG